MQCSRSPSGRCTVADPDVVRQRTLIGWMFEPLSPEHRNRVRQYLMDGDPKHLEGTQYEVKRRGVLAEMAPKKPLPEPAEPLSAEEFLKLVPGAAEVTGPEVQMFSSETAKFFLVVDADNSVVLQSKLTPEETLEMLHSVMHDVLDAIQRRDAGRN